jgi:uncharacterized protein (DUF302 family)
MKSETSTLPARRRFASTLCRSAILGLGLVLGIQSATASEYGHSKSISFTPFSRVATMEVVLDSNGEFDKSATDIKAKEAAKRLGYYLATVVEDSNLDPVYQGGDWILGGYEGPPPTQPDDVKHAILGIPTPNPIDQKVNVLDLCNKTYASMALGVKPIVEGKKVVNGYTHAPTLPCEVAIYYDADKIYVDMLDPSAIFKLFFSDVLFSDEMKDDDFARAIQAMPPQVKAELKSIIYSALSEFDPDLVQMDERLGPAYESIGDIINTVHASPNQSPYKHVAYTKAGGGVFVKGDTAFVAQTIIDTMSIHGEPGAGTHDDDLDAILSEGSLWRSARPTPLGIPGAPEKNYVIEACSPSYAKKALGTGAHHATALPCEISVQRVNLDASEDGTTEALVISYLDAHFMFGALFKDITDAEKEAYADLPTSVMNDLEAIVEYALSVDLGIKLNPGEQISYNMLPGKKSGHDNQN